MSIAEALKAVDERSRANRAAGAAAGDYESLYRTTTGNMGDINALVQALVSQMQQAGNPMGELDEEAIRNREAQRFSALAPSVDRAAAMAGSQGFAQAVRSGMGDSTQAADRAGALTREFGDMYAKLQENARTTAFQEALERLKSMLADKSASTQQLGTAANAVANYGNSAQRIAADRMQATSGSKAATNAALGKVFEKVLDSDTLRNVLGQADKALAPAASGAARQVGNWLGMDTTPQQYNLASLWESQGNNSGTGLRLDGGGLGLTAPSGSGSATGGSGEIDWGRILSTGPSSSMSAPAGGLQAAAPKFNTDYSSLLSGSSNPISSSVNNSSYEEPYQEWNSPSQSSWSDATETEWTW